MAVKKIKAGEVFGQLGVPKYPAAGLGYSQPLDHRRETGAVASSQPWKMNHREHFRIDFRAFSEHPGRRQRSALIQTAMKTIPFGLVLLSEFCGFLLEL